MSEFLEADPAGEFGKSADSVGLRELLEHEKSFTLSIGVQLRAVEMHAHTKSSS